MHFCTLIFFKNQEIPVTEPIVDDFPGLDIIYSIIHKMRVFNTHLTSKEHNA